jgi:hypothetical protein
MCPSHGGRYVGQAHEGRKAWPRGSRISAICCALYRRAALRRLEALRARDTVQSDGAVEFQVPLIILRRHRRRRYCSSHHPVHILDLLKGNNKLLLNAGGGERL